MPNQTCQSKTNLATQAYWAKPTKPNPPIQTKLLGKAVDAWVRSAFGNVSWITSIIFVLIQSQYYELKQIKAYKQMIQIMLRMINW